MKKVLRTLAVIAAVAMIATTLIVPASAEVTGGLWAEVCVNYNVVRIINGNTAVAGVPVAWLFEAPLTNQPEWMLNGSLVPAGPAGGRGVAVPSIIAVTDEDPEAGTFTWGFAEDPYTLGAGVMLGFFHSFPTAITSLADAEAAMGESIAIEYFAYCTLSAPPPETTPETTADDGGQTEPATTADGDGDATTPVATAPVTAAPATAAATTATTGDTVPATGIALAIIPTVIAAGAAIVAAKKRK